MEEVYNVELQHLDDNAMTDVPDHKFHGSSGIAYPGGSQHNRLQSQVSTYKTHTTYRTLRNDVPVCPVTHVYVLYNTFRHCSLVQHLSSWFLCHQMINLFLFCNCHTSLDNWQQHACEPSVNAHSQARLNCDPALSLHRDVV